MKTYETVIILKSNFTENECDWKIKNLKTQLVHYRITELKIDKLGLKNLAYEIKGKDAKMNKAGWYVHIIFNANDDLVVKALNSIYEADKDILKFVTVRSGENFTPEDITDILVTPEQELHKPTTTATTIDIFDLLYN